MRDSSKIGFHAAYVRDGEYVRESGVANAILGSYLRDMGFDLRVIKYITSPSPNEMQWLSIRDAIRVGISVYSGEDTLFASKARLPLRDGAYGGYPTALRSVQNFWKRWRSNGMMGLGESVEACYKRAAELRTLNAVQYCFTLDLLAIDLSEWGFRTHRLPILPYFTSGQANNRAMQMLSSLGMLDNAGQLLSEWQDFMLIGNVEANADVFRSQ